MSIFEQKMSYSATVSSLIRKRYSVNDELAILRQRDSKPDEFAEYKTYCEQCKAKAKLLIQGLNNIRQTFMKKFKK